MSALLDAGASADAVNKQGRTPLHNAVLAGRLPNAFNMLKAGADPNVTDYDGNLALHFACVGRGGHKVEGGCVAVARALLSAGDGKPVTSGSFSDPRKGLSKVEKHQLELEQIFSGGLDAVFAPPALTQRVETAAQLAARTNKHGVTPLMLACGAGLRGGPGWQEVRGNVVANRACR